MIDKDGDCDENHMDGDHDSDYDFTLQDYKWRLLQLVSHLFLNCSVSEVYAGIFWAVYWGLELDMKIEI